MRHEPCPILAGRPTDTGITTAIGVGDRQDWPDADRHRAATLDAGDVAGRRSRRADRHDRPCDHRRERRRRAAAIDSPIRRRPAGGRSRFRSRLGAVALPAQSADPRQRRRFGRAVAPSDRRGVRRRRGRAPVELVETAPYRPDRDRGPRRSLRLPVRPRRRPGPGVPFAAECGAGGPRPPGPNRQRSGAGGRTARRCERRVAGGCSPDP